MPAAQPGIASTSGPNGPPQWNDSSLRAQIRAQRTRSHRWLARAGQRSQCCATDSREKSSLMANPEGPPDFTLLRIEDPKQKIPAFTLSGLPDGWRRTAQGHAGTGNGLTAQGRVRHPKGPVPSFPRRQISSSIRFIRTRSAFGLQLRSHIRLMSA
jgi:hypothetical protein